VAAGAAVFIACLLLHYLYYAHVLGPRLRSGEAAERRLAMEPLRRKARLAEAAAARLAAEQQALDRIAQSEAAAAKQVRDTAIDVALGATRALLREQVGTGRTAALIDESIAELPRRQH